jgi:hypothetical protein
MGSNMGSTSLLLFMCIKTEKLKFVDISNYLAPGFSYSQYLKAYKCREQKGFFPYEWMTSLDKLLQCESGNADAVFKHIDVAILVKLKHLVDGFQHGFDVFVVRWGPEHRVSSLP